MFEDSKNFEKSYKNKHIFISDNYPLIYNVYGGHLRNLYQNKKPLINYSIAHYFKKKILSFFYLIFLSKDLFSKVKICVHSLGDNQFQAKSLSEYLLKNYDIGTKRLSISLISSFLIPNISVKIFTKPSSFKNRTKKSLILNLIEFRLRLAFYILQFYIIKMNITFYICNGHTTPHSALFSYVCSKLNIPVISISHGYIQNPLLRTLYPLNIDLFLVWSKNQENEIRKVLEDKDKNKIFFAGFPRKFDFVNSSSQDKIKIVFVLPPLKKILDDENAKRLFCDFISKASINYELLFKFHPRDDIQTSIKKLKELELILDSEILVSTNTDLLLRNNIIVSLGSSLLFELAHYKNNIFQINNSIWPTVEYVISINDYEDFELKFNISKEDKSCSKSNNPKIYLDQNWIKVFKRIHEIKSKK